ncbi:unnamed protein product [Rotaria magnacalcarata]|uniref:Vitellogenin domain-containing protein n=4 Tax=Rotaria magnacalcarata TaxID=392030 RepID=A0A814J7G4_9BILA|nr:unnamed protein product [Rotaria magnacalcarata]
MAVSLNLCFSLVLLLVYRASAAPISPGNADSLCSFAQLVAPGQDSLVYKYKTEVKLSVVNGQFDLKNEISANVHIKNLGNCNYALQLQNVVIMETQDEDESTVSTPAKQELENLVVRFRWADGFVVAVEADASANIDHVNFVKGIISALQVYSPVPTDGENILREEDVLGVCTTRYKYSQKDGVTKITKNKDLSTCSKDKLHLSSSPVLTSLLGPLVEQAFAAKTSYVCQTEITNKKVKSVKCKTIEIEDGDSEKSSKTDKDSSSEEDNDIDFDDKDEEISSKLVSIKQTLELTTSSAVNVDASAVKNPVRQTLQFVPTASFDKSTESVSDIVEKIKGLLTSKDWDQFAATRFLEVTNELRRMGKADINAFKSNADIKNLVPMFLNTIYAHDPAATLFNFDSANLKFENPLSVFYLDSPSTELVDQIVQSAKRLTAEQVPDFVGLAATILKKYKARQNSQDADRKIKDFQKSVSKFLTAPTGDDTKVVTAALAAYAQLGLYDNQVKNLAAEQHLEVQYHALNAIRHIDDDYIDDADELNIRTDLQNVLLEKLQNKENKNAVRVWAFEALYTPFIFNSEESDPTLSDNLEKAFSTILDEPLNQVNGYMWSVLKFSSLDRLDPLRGLAARLRVHHDNKKQFSEQSTLSSRHVELEIPLRKNYRAVIHLSVVFENDRVVPSFIGAKLAFDGVRRETIRLPWIDGALIIENLDSNVAEYFLRLDPLNKNKNVDDTYRTNTKNSLPGSTKRLQDTYDGVEDDSSSSVHLYLKLFGADIRSRDITDKVQDLLSSNIRTFVRNQVLARLQQLSGKNPIFRIPLEIGAASAAANGLTLYKSAQVALLADLSSDFGDTRGTDGLGKFKLTSRSALSFSLTLQREISSPLSTIGETVQVGVLSNTPFEYEAVANKDGRTREFNLLNDKSIVMATDFQYALRTSKGLKSVQHQKTPTIDPSCTPSTVYRALGIRACLELNPFRSIQLGSRPSYPITVSITKDPSVKKWRLGWRFNAADAPQYEVAVEKVGATGTYPGLGLSATKDGSKFDIKVLTGMKSFNVKGTQSGNKFDGKIYTSDSKEVMTTSGTLVANSDGFKLDSKVYDISSKKEVLALKTEIKPNQGQGLTLDIDLTTPDKAKSFKIHFHGDLYKPEKKLFHLDGGFNLGEVMYNGKVHLERGDAQTRIELQRTLKFGKSAAQSGYSFLYERKTKQVDNQKNCNVGSHFSLRTPTSDQATKLFDFKADFTRAIDLSSATLQSSLDFIIMTRSPPVPERIELDYIRKSARANSQAKRLISPEGSLKIQVKTKSNVFNFLLDHKHRRSADAAKKGPVSAPPTLNIANKIHIAADTDKLLPDIPRPFAFDFSSELDFELLNKIDYKFQYELRRRQAAGSLTYHGQVDKITDGHLFSGTSQTELQWNNKLNKATAVGSFSICKNSRSLKTHWDIDTSLVPDKKDMELDLNIRFDRQPKQNSPKSLILAYDVTLKAPKHKLVQLIDLDGNFTKQIGKLETYNSIAYRIDTGLKEINLNLIVNRNQIGDGSLTTHVAISLPFKNLPYITHYLKLQRCPISKRPVYIESRLLAKPVFSHVAAIGINRTSSGQPPHVTVENQIEYLRSNGDVLFGLSKVEVQRWSKLHSFGFLKRSNAVLHRHSIGYVFSPKTRKVALSLESPQLPGNPLSFIVELTIDRENRIGKMQWPQEFGFHFEFGTPLSNLTALKVFYNLPMFNKNSQTRIDGAVGFKLASPKVTPVDFYIKARGSLDTTFQLVETVNIGEDISLNALLTAQYNPGSISQISASTSTKFYDREFQNSLYALLKQHQVVIRGILNTTDNQDYKYEMDIGFDDDLLTGHTERTDGQQIVASDISANKCSPTGKYNRCYKGDITVQAGSSGASKKGSFDASWGSGTAKLEVKVPEQVEIKFDHTHTGRIRDDDFSSKTLIEGKSLRADNKGAFSYSGAVEKDDGKWNSFQLETALLDMKTGQKSLVSNIGFTQKVTNKLAGEFQRKIDVKVQRQGLTFVDWSSESVTCKGNPTNVLTGLCQTATFTMKTSNVLVQRLRQRLQLPVDAKLANPAGQITYDGTLKLDVKFDPKSGPHTVSFDLNRAKEDAIDVNVVFQQRYDRQPMSVQINANLPRQDPISVKYNEQIRSGTNFQGTLKYSFNANDKSAEKTYQCEVDRPDPTDFSINCVGERTTLVIDIDRNLGKSKVYVDLNRFAGERFGFEAVRDPQTKDLDATLYTLITSWNVKRNPGKSTVVSIKQKDKEVLRVEATKVSDQEIQIKFLPTNVNLKLQWDKSTVITLKQTSPQDRDLLSITIDREKIRPYLPSLRNQNRPSYDIDQVSTKSSKPLVEIALDSHVILSISQAIGKLGSHNGLYGLDTVKKAFKLQIGDVPLTIYNIQHWKTHKENSHLPESYALHIVNNANGNTVQLATAKWNEVRLIAKLSHSFDGGKTLTTDLKLDRNYAHEVGSVYFFHSLGYRNIEGARQLRNFTRNFIRSNILKVLPSTNAVELIKLFRGRVRSILDVDYNAFKAIVATWNQESEKSFLRQWSTRLGLAEFFAKYPTYGEASDRIFALLGERHVARDAFWRERIEAIVNDNRLKDLSDRLQTRREALIKRLSAYAELALDRILPKVDQADIDKRIANCVGKLVGGFEQVSKRNTEQWKAVFKLIDNASKGEDTKWFRTLVADIDSAAFAAAADAESAKVFKKLSDSSKLLIANLQQFSRRITKRREAIRERVKNAIRHIPKAFVNTTNFELLVPIGRQPGSYAGTSELMLGIGSLLRNRDQALDTIRSVLVNRMESRSETSQNYFKLLRAVGKRFFKRNPSLTPEFQAVIAPTGDAIDVHGHYIYLNPACGYVLAHDFADLQFSFNFANGKVQSVIGNEGEIKENDCSNTGRVQVCNDGGFYTISVPMHYGGRVNGALGDVRDRNEKESNDFSRWLLYRCPEAGAGQPSKTGQAIPECFSEDDDEQQFCENFVLNGVKSGKERRVLVAQISQARKTIL